MEITVAEFCGDLAKRGYPATANMPPREYEYAAERRRLRNGDAARRGSGQVAVDRTPEHGCIRFLALRYGGRVVVNGKTGARPARPSPL